MIRTILVPVDRSDLSEHAIPYAVGIARCSGARVELALVHLPLEASAHRHRGLEDKIRHDEHIYLQNLRCALEEVSGVRSASVVLDGPVAAALSQHAQTVEADLVVMATRARGGLARMRLGSVADGVVRRSPAPVLLVRPREGDAEPFRAISLQHILLPVDGSPVADQAVPMTASLAGQQRARLTLLTIIPPGQAGRHGSPDPLLRHQAEAHLAALVQAVRERVEQVDWYVSAHPAAAQGIVQEAEVLGADLISMATHGRGGLSRMLLGSVAQSVLHSSPVPLLLHTERALRKSAYGMERVLAPAGHTGSIPG